MKTRNGHVSNSSSSSFIIAVDKDKQHLIGILEDIIERGKEDSYTESFIDSLPTDVEGIKRVMIKDWGWWEPSITETLEDVKELLDADKVLYELEIDYHDSNDAWDFLQANSDTIKYIDLN